MYVVEIVVEEQAVRAPRRRSAARNFLASCRHVDVTEISFVQHFCCFWLTIKSRTGEQFAYINIDNKVSFEVMGDVEKSCLHT